MIRARAYWSTGVGVGELREVEVADAAPGQSLVRASCSGISRGTERLVGAGRVPLSGYDQMKCRSMGGAFPFPVKYGYALVGLGIDGALADQRIFVMHPHQEVATINDEDAILLPDTVPSPRATLFANLETALNAVWDAPEPTTENAPARPLIVGAGAVGLLIGFCCRHEWGRTVDVIEEDTARRAAISTLPWVHEALSPADAEGRSAPVAWHTSGSPRGLQTALDAVGFEGFVVDLSWYGDTPVTLDLGSGFHWDRKRIISSQVAHVAPRQRSGEDAGFSTRRDRVLALLEDPALDALLAPPTPFDDLPRTMAAIHHGGGPAPHPVITYA